MFIRDSFVDFGKLIKSKRWLTTGYVSLSVVLDSVFIVLLSFFYMNFIFKIQEPLQKLVPLIQKQQAGLEKSLAEKGAGMSAVLQDNALIRMQMDTILWAFVIFCLWFLLLWVILKGINWVAASALVNKMESWKEFGRRLLRFAVVSLGFAVLFALGFYLLIFLFKL